MVRLFDIQNGEVVPTEHCYTLKTLKMIMIEYPQNYLRVYAYLFYMTCPDGELNPFADAPESEKEELILSQLYVDFSTEDEVILEALTFCHKLYETPTTRAYMGIKSMLDRLAKYMESTPITHGRDGNITALVNTAAKFEMIRQSFKGAHKDLQEELKGHGRGGQEIAYDQQ